jgi:hypothetical protein
MENNKENFSPEESLKVIQTMISQTKNSVADKSFYFLLWGWLVFIGATLLLTGRLLKFAPLVWGAVACWGLAILTTYVNTDTNILLMAVAILISYIIPGHLLRKAYKRQLLKQPN